MKLEKTGRLGKVVPSTGMIKVNILVFSAAVLKAAVSSYIYGASFSNIVSVVEADNDGKIANTSRSVPDQDDTFGPLLVFLL